jgi:hypothetical protein
MSNNSDGGQNAVVLLIITVAGTLIAGFILWLLPSEWQSAIQLVIKEKWHWIIVVVVSILLLIVLKKKWRWIVERLYPRHKETPEKTEFLNFDSTVEIEIGDEAKQLLIETSQDKNGIILKARSSSGTFIGMSGKNNMIPSPHDARTVAKWEQAIKELLENGFIEERGYKGEVFAVTHKGYEYTDKLQGSI